MSVEVICHSVSTKGKEIITLACTYPRYIHAEQLTHRQISKNSSSSRAIPVWRMLKNVLSDMAMPYYWGKNAPGMQAHEELPAYRKYLAMGIWTMACYFACFFSFLLHKLGLHKQHANRITEPFQYITVLMTATEWENYFNLRCHKDAQPEIQMLANKIKAAIAGSTPKLLKEGQWHLPYIKEDETKKYGLHDLRILSSARCARVSYLTHDKKNPEYHKDVELFNKLVGSEPLHASPLEHVATPTHKGNTNFVGWKQYRKEVETVIS